MIRRLIVLALLVSACGSAEVASTPSPTPAIGDGCLVGRWVETRESAPGNWTLYGETVLVTGLDGLVVTFAAGGGEADDYTNAQPLNGGWRGHQIKIVMSGLVTFNVHADGSHIVRTSTSSNPTVAFYLDGALRTDSGARFPAAPISYKCAGSFLHLETPAWNAGTSPQLDDFTRG